MKRSASYHHPDLEKVLRESALEELKEHGTADFSLRRVASRAGVSHTAPYRHFHDKDELLAAIGWETSKAFTTALLASRKETKGSAQDRLCAIGETYLSYARSHPELVSLMFSEAGMTAMNKYHPEITPEAISAHDSFAVLETTVKECQAEGILDPTGDSGAIAILVWSMVHGMAVLDREGFLSSMGGFRGLTGDQSKRLVMDSFFTLIERNARR